MLLNSSDAIVPKHDIHPLLYATMTQAKLLAPVPIDR